MNGNQDPELPSWNALHYALISFALAGVHEQPFQQKTLHLSNIPAYHHSDQPAFTDEVLLASFLFVC